MAKEKKPKELKLTFEQLIAMHQQQRALIESLANQENLVRNLIRETQATQDALNEIKKTKKLTNILVPLGSGIFAYAKLADTSEVKMEIGGNVFESMPISKAINKLEDRKAGFERNLKQIIERKRKAIALITQLEQLIAEAQRKAREQVQGVA
ncbi:MAG: prefoldin subunit alpha [Candidatus Iainarchaeum archaeon]|uniref:Prefoldin subunit alpha n=1 Tax=Candidatus Iainarchaeum sp. TaxID=3101447 RepID=A0A497JJW0_9ARCH|nr:MAG: prefoldin subunit alpha [Candidatus Diapherotrites archaeon]